MNNSSLDSPHQGFSNSDRFMSLASIDGKIDRCIMFKTFSIVTRHLLMLKIWNDHHPMRLNETNPTSYHLSLSNQ
jgi:hypothetical protein